MKAPITIEQAMAHPEVGAAIETLVVMQNRKAIEAAEQCRQIIYDATHPGNIQSEVIWVNAKARINLLLKALNESIQTKPEPTDWAAS